VARSAASLAADVVPLHEAHFAQAVEVGEAPGVVERGLVADEGDVELLLLPAHELGDPARAAVAGREDRERRHEQHASPRRRTQPKAVRRMQARVDQGRRHERLGRAPPRNALAQHAGRLRHACELALALIGKLARSREKPRRTAGAGAVPQIEQHAVALDDPHQRPAVVEARRGGAVPVRHSRARAEHDRVSVAPRPYAPLDVLPIERIVGAAAAEIAAQERRSKQCRAAARTQVRRRRAGRRHGGVIEVEAVATDVPVGEPRLLAAAGGVLLEDLRPDRERALVAQRKERRERVGLDRHVVVQKIRRAVARGGEPALDRAGEAERGVAVDPLDVGKICLDFVVRRTRGAVGDDDDLPRFADRAKREGERRQGFGEHRRRVAVRNDHRQARGPGPDGARLSRGNERGNAIGGDDGGIQRRESQALPPAGSPHLALSDGAVGRP
jgi:hypothetical protein